jgi:hypothetical protein
VEEEVEEEAMEEVDIVQKVLAITDIMECHLFLQNQDVLKRTVQNLKNNVLLIVNKTFLMIKLNLRIVNNNVVLNMEHNDKLIGEFLQLWLLLLLAL